MTPRCARFYDDSSRCEFFEGHQGKCGPWPFTNRQDAVSAAIGNMMIKDNDGDVACIRQDISTGYVGQGTPWADYLHFRLRLIHAFMQEGKTPEWIADKLCVDVMQVQLLQLTPLDHDREFRTKPDIRGIIEALGFDPTNHHNAAKCPYCTPESTLKILAQRVDNLEKAANVIFDTFTKDEVQGYRSKDRQFAIDILGPVLEK